MIQAPPRTILEVFENLPEGTLAQVINNQLVMAPSPDFFHQDIVGEIFMQLRNHVLDKKLGKAIPAPMDVYLNRKNVYQPDILFIAADRINELVQEGKIKGAPDLVVEVLSPGTENIDRTTKKEVYEQSGVKEYWMVDPKSKKAEGFILTNGSYKALPVQSGQLTFALLNISISF